MAFTAVNPKYVSYESAPAPLRKVRAADSQTWVRGQIGYLSSGTVTPISGLTGGDTAPYYIFAEDQATSTSTSDVWVRPLQVGDRLEIYVTNAGTAAAVGQANVGTKYSLREDSGVVTLDINDTTNADWEVERLFADIEPERNATADAPGRCIVKLV